MKARALRPKRSEPVHQEPELWLITFCDLLMVLVSMFALIFSMNVISERALRSALARVRASAGPTGTPGTAEPAREWPTDPALDAAGRALAHQLTDGLTHLLGRPAERPADGNTRYYAGGLAIAYSPNALTAHLGPGSFALDSSELSFEGEESIRVMARALKGTAFPIEIETYQAAGKPAEHDLRWQLAQSRSLAVLRRFLDTGVGPSTLSVAGYVGKDRPGNPGKDGDETVIRVELPRPLTAQVNSQSSLYEKEPITRIAGMDAGSRQDFP